MVRSPFNFDPDVVSFQSGIDFSNSPSRAQQHFRDETDINVMVQRFQRTGVPPAPPVPLMSEFDEVFDFQSAMDMVVKAKQAFATLPSKVRSRFQNDPGKFLEFFNDPENAPEAIRMGLASALPEPVPAADNAVPLSSDNTPQESS